MRPGSGCLKIIPTTKSGRPYRLPRLRPGESRLCISGKIFWRSRPSLGVLPTCQDRQTGPGRIKIREHIKIGSKIFFMDLHLEVLTQSRQELLPKMAGWRNEFYLAGGTALALQLGHRQSVDFDFFGLKDFEPLVFFESVKTAFVGHRAAFEQEAKNTLHIKIDGEIELSFFKHPYALVCPPVASEYLDLASLQDIACMELTAIMDRHYFRDFVDLYAICQKISLGEIFQAAKIKYPTLETSALFYQLQYFGDVKEEKIIFKNNFYADIETIEKFFKQEIKKLFDIR